MTNPAVIASRQREGEAIRLRLAGLSLDQIAQQLGIEETSVGNLIKRGLLRNPAPPTAELRDIAVRRCERMLQAVWGKVIGGDMDAIRTALAIEARRARLLGLDAPQAVDMRVHIEALARIAGRDVDEAIAEAEAIVARGGIR